MIRKFIEKISVPASAACLDGYWEFKCLEPTISIWARRWVSFVVPYCTRQNGSWEYIGRC